MANPAATADVAEIDRVTRLFFAAFTSKGGAKPDVDGLHALFAAGGVIAKCGGAAPEIFTLDQFIEPRRRLLTSGSLTEFEEHEVSARTEVLGSIAVRSCVYEKSGILGGEPFAARGVKTFQLVRSGGAWKLLAVAWEDEPARS